MEFAGTEGAHGGHGGLPVRRVVVVVMMRIEVEKEAGDKTCWRKRSFSRSRSPQ